MSKYTYYFLYIKVELIKLKMVENQLRYRLRVGTDEYTSDGNYIFVPSATDRGQEVVWEFTVEDRGRKLQSYQFMFGNSPLAHIRSNNFSLIADHPHPAFNIVCKDFNDPTAHWYIRFGRENNCVEVVFI